MKRGAMDVRQEQPPRYKIQVKMVKTVALDVKSTDTVDQIKTKISAIEGIGKSQQVLFFCGNHLENNNRLADYNIMTNSSVDLYVTDGMQISVSIPSVGKIIKLNLKKSQSVADVKSEIEQKVGIPLDEQILMYGCQQLEDNKLLSQCGLSNGHTLHVLVCPTDKLRISINVDGERTVNLDVKSWYTVADVKLMIETFEGLPACSQILMRTQPGGAETLKDTETLQNQHIRNNDTLMLHQNIQFFVKTYEGKTLTMSMRTCDTTDKVMEKVAAKLMMMAGVYYLHYGGHVMCPEDTLQKHKVANNSTVDIRLRNSNVVS
ncbi:polyubiquitin-like [Panicum hallii]|nr:polyubiquitin-like [Panicum hallii]